MDRTAIFVDAGYLFAAGSLVLAGRKLRRGQCYLENEAFLAFICERAATYSDSLPLLRVYWYDGTAGPPSPAHTKLAYHSNVKLRLGLVNNQGQQKGVDSLIVTDLINLSRNGAIASAVLMSGDEDVRVGVLQAQEYGVRVHLVGIESPDGEGRNLAALLQQEVDSVHHLTKDEVASFLRVEGSLPKAAETPAQQLPEQASGCSDLSDEQIERIILETTKVMEPEQIAEVGEVTGYAVPKQFDGLLLTTASKVLGGIRVPDGSKGRLRSKFLESCRKLHQLKQ